MSIKIKKVHKMCTNYMIMISVPVLGQPQEESLGKVWATVWAVRRIRREKREEETKRVSACLLR